MAFLVSVVGVLSWVVVDDDDDNWKGAVRYMIFEDGEECGY